MYSQEDEDEIGDGLVIFFLYMTFLHLPLFAFWGIIDLIIKCQPLWTKDGSNNTRDSKELYWDIEMVLEIPTWKTYTTVHLPILAVLIIALAQFRHQPRKLRSVAFSLHALTTTALGCLSALSRWLMIIDDAREASITLAFLKALFIRIPIFCPHWDWT